MNSKILRMAAVSATAAIALGAGSGLAQASDARPAAGATQSTGAALSSLDARALLDNEDIVAELSAEEVQSLNAVASGTATEAQAQGAISSAAKAFFNMLKKSNIWGKALNAAKGGWGKFKGYLDGLPWYHPVRIGWIALGAEVQYQVYAYIRDSL